MDLALRGARPPPEERAAVVVVLGPPASGWGAAGRSRTATRPSADGSTGRVAAHLLLPALHAVNDRSAGSAGARVNYIGEQRRPPAEVYGVLTFYALFSPRAPPPAPGPRLHDLACAPKPRGLDRGRSAGLPPAALAPLAVSRAVRAGAGGTGGRGRWSRRRVRRRRPRPIVRPPWTARGPGRAPGVGCPRPATLRCSCSGGRPRRPARHRRLPRRRRLRGAAARAIGPGRRHRRGHRLRAGGPRRRGVPDRTQVGGGGRGQPGGRTTWSATPTSPSRAPSRTGC